MKKQIVFVLAIIITVPAASPVSAEILYNIIDLGTLGGEESYASSINDAGQIVGYSYHATNHRRAAFIWDSNDGMRDITPGEEESYARALNNAGQVVGYSYTASGEEYSFIWDSTNGLRNLGIGRKRPMAINDLGQFVSYAMTEIEFDELAILALRAFLHTEGDAGVDLGTLGGFASSAFGINDLGQVVGCSCFSPSSQSMHAFIWENSIMRDLGTLGGIESKAFAINENSVVVGCSETADGKRHAVMWSSDESADLGTLGGRESMARGINDSGAVVGLSYTLDGQSHMFIFRNGVMIDLNDLVDPTVGWVLVSACGINNNGWIVGKGINPDGRRRAVLLTPTPRKIAIDNIEDAIYEKLEALEWIDGALEKEWDAVESLNELLASGEYGGLGRVDIVRAKICVLHSMIGEYRSRRELTKSIRDLKRSLEYLGWEFNYPPIDRPPIVNIIKPQDGAVFYAFFGSTTIAVEAEAWDADGSVLKVEFFADGNCIGEDNDGTNGWKTDLVNAASGTYSLTAKATDDDEATATSPAVIITVKEGMFPPRPRWPRSQFENKANRIAKQ